MSDEIESFGESQEIVTATNNRTKKRPLVVNGNHDSTEVDPEVAHFRQRAQKRHSDLLAVAKQLGLSIRSDEDMPSFLSRIDKLPIASGGCIKEDYIVDDDEVESSLDESSGSSSSDASSDQNDDIESITDSLDDDKNGDGTTGSSNRQGHGNKKKYNLGQKSGKSLREKLQREVELLRASAPTYIIASDNDEEEEDHINDGKTRVRTQSRVGKYRLRKKIVKPVTKVQIAKELRRGGIVGRCKRLGRLSTRTGEEQDAIVLPDDGEAHRRYAQNDLQDLTHDIVEDDEVVAVEEEGTAATEATSCLFANQSAAEEQDPIEE